MRNTFVKESTVGTVLRTTKMEETNPEDSAHTVEEFATALVVPEMILW